MSPELKNECRAQLSHAIASAYRDMHTASTIGMPKYRSVVTDSWTQRILHLQELLAELESL